MTTLKTRVLYAAAGLALAAAFQASHANACPGTPAQFDPSSLSPAPTQQTADDQTEPGGPSYDSGVAQPSGPAMPVPCGPPPWVTGGAAPSAAGPQYPTTPPTATGAYEPNSNTPAPPPMQYATTPPPAYSATPSAPAPYASTPPPTYSRGPTTPAPTYSRGPTTPAPTYSVGSATPPPTYSTGTTPPPTYSRGPTTTASNYATSPDAAAPPVYYSGPQQYVPSPGVVPPPEMAPPQTPAPTYSYTPPPVYEAPQPVLPTAPYPPAYRTAIAPKLSPWLKVLSPQDEERYARAYAAGDARLYTSADALLAEVDDPVLQGSVLARRYTSKSTYNPRYAELYAWLTSYSDNAEADAIYAAALPKMTGDFGPPPKPDRAKPRSFAASGLKQTQAFAPRPTAPTSQANINAAEQAFYSAQPEQALMIAAPEIGQALDGDARYISGLANFRLRRFGDAAQLLDAAARTRYYAPGEIAAAAYWAGRAHLAAGQTQEALGAFKFAAAQPLTFYGTLAERQLGREPSYRPPVVATLDASNAADLFARYPAAKRAAALAQLGHLNDAEAEIKALQRKVDPSEDVRLLSLAQSLGLASTATRLAEMGGPELAAGLYPDAPYAPKDGFRLNKALLFGIARQESRLNPEAVSVSNARGLMQLLPSTAAWIGKNPQYKASPDLLFDPLINMKLGQDYVEHLFDEVSPDLVRVLAAYNMGPGALKRWLASVGDFNDPLLLIESIPKDETRNYVKRVLANMWLYEARYGQPSPTLEAMAAGKAPYYSGTARIY
ncbi:MAG: transglycosylase SLT domain-containing protein [Caulobacterales bacterium]